MGYSHHICNVTWKLTSPFRCIIMRYLLVAAMFEFLLLWNFEPYREWLEKQKCGSLYTIYGLVVGGFSRGDM